MSMYKLKLQLQKEKAEQDANRNRMNAGVPVSTKSQQSTPAINLPQLSQSTAAVPQNVLQVQSRLSNPTQYHVQQKQRSQVQEYLSQSLGNTKAMTHKLVPYNNNAKASSLTTSGGGVSSLHSTPASPLARLNLSSSIDQHMDDVIDNIVSLENSYEDQSHLSTTLPTVAPNMLHDFSSQASQDFRNIQSQDTTSSSCPPEFMPKVEYTGDNTDYAVFMQERVKKDNHNRIERKRRYNINDRIKELGTLIPKTNDPDMRWNKGSILKASVDHMKILQRKVSRTKQVEDKEREMRNINKRLLLRIQELELAAQSSGVQLPQMSDKEDIVNTLLKPENSLSPSSFTTEQETDVACFPSAIVTSPQQQFNHQPSASPQQFLFQTNFGSPQHNIPLQQQHINLIPAQTQAQQVVTIDITSPAHSVSPGPTSNFSNVGIEQTSPFSDSSSQPLSNNPPSVGEFNMSSFDTELQDLLMSTNSTHTSSLTDLLNSSEHQTLNDILMDEDSQGPIKSDIFLSEAQN